MRRYTTEEFMKSNKNLHLERKDSEIGARDGMHTHDFIEIVYVLSGEMTHEINGCAYHAARGDLLFMNYGCTHIFSSDDAFSYLNNVNRHEILRCLKRLNKEERTIIVLVASSLNDVDKIINRLVIIDSND